MDMSKCKSIVHSGRGHFASSLQWFVFIFCNTIVVPPTIASAFHLSVSTSIIVTQFMFLSTALACFTQAVWGHKRTIMEGPSGLWWGTILTLALTESAQGTPIATIGYSLAIGIFLSGIITVLVGLSGLGFMLSKLFKPGVMVVFMFLLGEQLISIFLKGMVGLPFNTQLGAINFNIQSFLISLLVAFAVIIIIVFSPRRINRFAFPFSLLIGWGLAFMFKLAPLDLAMHAGFKLFPLGISSHIEYGIVVLAILTGLINVSNTFGAITGTDHFYKKSTYPIKSMYQRSFLVSGIATSLTAPLGIVPFSPFVSSIGLIEQTQDVNRKPFILGAAIFFVVGCSTYMTLFFASLPLFVTSAIMFVAYLPLLFSALSFTQRIELTSKNIYRIAIPIFVGLFIMRLPSEFTAHLPLMIRPIISNGLLMGIILSITLENILNWDNIK